MSNVWKTPTRRAFVTMLGLGAALAVVKVKVKRSEPEKPVAPVVPGTLWIGHC